MIFKFSPAGIIHLVSTILCAFLALLVLIRRVKPGGGTFGLLLFSLAVWSLAAALEDGSVDFAFKYSCSKLSYLGIAASPALLLMFALEYSRNSHLLTRRNLLILWVIPAVSIFMAFTNEKHLLLWSSVVASPGTNGELLVYNHGIYFWVHVAYSYICLLTANYLLVRTALLFSKKIRIQVYVLFIAVLIPWVGNIIYITGSSPVEGLDLTPISFAASAILIAWSIFRLQFFGIIPVARDLVIETTSDAILVLDNDNRILDINAAALHLLFSEKTHLIGRNLQDVMNNMPKVFTAIKNIPQGRIEIELKTPQQKTLDINVTPLCDQKGQTNGRILVLRDITELKSIQNQEREQRIFASSLSDIASALNGLKDVNEVMDRILLEVNRVVPHDSSSIALLDENNVVTFVRSHGYEKTGLDRVINRLKLDLDDVYILKEMYKSHQPLICNDTKNDPKWIPIKKSEWIRSYFGVPILLGGNVIGFINLDSRKPGFFSSKSSPRLQAFANHAALAIENARLIERLQKMAITDGLTGLFNLRHFEAIAEKELQRAVRYKKNLSLIMLDIDHFKQVNDRFGHHAGDQALQNVAKLCGQKLRKMDIVARIGGEEFAILLPETRLERAVLVAERLREGIASMPNQVMDKMVFVTASLGVADLQSCQPDFRDVMDCADKALYAAKRAGRNQVKVYSRIS